MKKYLFISSMFLLISVAYKAKGMDQSPQQSPNLIRALTSRSINGKKLIHYNKPNVFPSADLRMAKNTKTGKMELFFTSDNYRNTKQAFLDTTTDCLHAAELAAQSLTSIQFRRHFDE